MPIDIDTARAGDDEEGDDEKEAFQKSQSKPSRGDSPVVDARLATQLQQIGRKIAGYADRDPT